MALAAREGLVGTPKTLPPWLFYDERGSALFEQITALPEYYLTRTERAIFAEHAESILARMGGPVTVIELGAGTASKTGILLRAAVARQGAVVYQPLDVSPSALEIAASTLERELPGVTVQTEIANYVTEPYRVERTAGTRVLALYIGSSIGNFSPTQAQGILAQLRSQLQPGDALLLGTDLAPRGEGGGMGKSRETLLAAYDDAAGVTATFNRNMLEHLNQRIGTDFNPQLFEHRAVWNAEQSRMEMHLVSAVAQTVLLPADGAGPRVELPFEAGETIHTENSYKFTPEAIGSLLGSAGFAVGQRFCDPEELYAVTLAPAV